ncbi:MAG: HAMP domain-containing protein [Candidatus Omnitrophica bacterium]|nr:HAMP domain-containing protein [Candidatus Omnitrophota bacterium]MDE2223280.1 HAMP domain-containing protein [Candidatus Omnitrophota bacterium]
MKFNPIKFEAVFYYTAILGLLLLIFISILHLTHHGGAAFAVALLLALPLANLMGRRLVHKVMHPVHEIIDMAKRITEHDLSARIRPTRFDPEMRSLIESFNEMIARLETSFKHIEQFSHHVAHELKTPLTIIQGEAELLLRRERSVHEYKQALRIVMEESQRVLKTIDDLLLLTKLGYQQEVFKFEHFDFIEFFNEIVEQNRLMAANKGIGISMDLHNAVPPLMIKADRLHLRRLFFNLIDNAFKFTPEGGCVNMSISKKDGRIVSLISDTGPGIAAESLEKIFEAFYREGKNEPGNGLGLSIAHRIARLHEGDIQVESFPGQGTTFKVVLPCAHLAVENALQFQH